MKKVVFFSTLFLLFFLVSCVELEKAREQIVEKEQTSSPLKEIKEEIAPKQQLLSLLNKHNTIKEYSATLQTITNKSDGTYNEQTTIFIKGYNFRTDGAIKIMKGEDSKAVVLEEKRAKVILNNNTYFECIYENEWICTKTEISEKEANDLRKNAKDDDYIKFVEKSTVKFLRESAFEGQKTICFSIEGEECYLENSGMMVSSKKKDAEIKLLKYSATVEDSLFELPKDAEEITEDAENQS